jgi:N-acetyl-anhydromuramoyl-L-alanine amidase
VPYDDAQYATLAALIDALRARYPIEAVVGHSDIAPGRKTDPGGAFDWSRVPQVPL